MKKAEKIILTISFLAIALKLIDIVGANILTIISLSSLSLFYIVSSYFLLKEKNTEQKNKSSLRVIGSFYVGIALTITINGILFRLLSWPGSLMMLYIGTFGVCIVSMISILKFIKTNSSFYKGVLYRVVLWGFFSLVLILIPDKIWINFKYRKHPAYAAALINSHQQPDNDSLREISNVERKKMIMNR